MRILFYGDSITDAGSYRKPRDRFAGYVKYAAELLGDGNEYFNCGVGGDKSADLLARYERDVKPFSPDVFVLLVGINDVAWGFSHEAYIPPETYGRNVRALLARVRADFPAAKIVLLEPFMLPFAQRRYWRRELALFIEEARDIAAETADVFVPLDGPLNAARVEVGDGALTADGVHPAEYAQRLIARHVAAAIGRLVG